MEKTVLQLQLNSIIISNYMETVKHSGTLWSHLKYSLLYDYFILLYSEKSYDSHF